MKLKPGQKRALMLNSGGFDSIVLHHKLVSEGYKVTSLFFDYGQNNAEQELRSVERLNEHHIMLNLPPFSWSKATITTNGEHLESVHQEYVEMRNLIFLSYAVSIAEAHAIKDVYFAVIKTPTTYKDACHQFVKDFNIISRTCDIEIHTPFLDMEKKELMNLAKKFDVTQEDFFSCYYPAQNNKPCVLPYKVNESVRLCAVCLITVNFGL